MALIVVVGLVHAQTVVPEHQHVWLPPQPARKRRLREMLAEVTKDRRRFLRLQAFEVDSVGSVDVKRLLSRMRVSPHQRMYAAPNLRHEIIREALSAAGRRKPADGSVPVLDRTLRRG